jgi:hypothetical protein
VLTTAYNDLEQLGAEPELLATVGSWRDTLDDEEVLNLLSNATVASLLALIVNKLPILNSYGRHHFLTVGIGVLQLVTITIRKKTAVGSQRHWQSALCISLAVQTTLCLTEAQLHES